MKLCDKTLEELGGLITGDDKKIQYRSGSMLVKFFNKLGFRDSYIWGGVGFSNGKSSRKDYTQNKLQQINGTPEIDICIKNLFSPVNFIEKTDILQNVLAEFNQYLNFDGWNIIIQGKEVIIKKAGVFELKPTEKPAETETEFLAKQFDDVNFNLLNLENSLIPVLQQRLDEIKQCINNGAFLSVIFLCGSTLEGVLLGVAQRHPKEFNTANSAPKDDKDGKTKKFKDWSLSNLIDVAYEVNFIDLDVKKFSYSLRDFRNYIHPYEQMKQKFNPTEDTAKICLQIFKTTLNQLSKI